MAWRITYSETTMYRVPQRRGPGPFKRLLWAILGLAAGGAVMWFLARGGAGELSVLAGHAVRGRGVLSARPGDEPAGQAMSEKGEAGELAGLEEAEGIYPVAHGSPVYAAPDTRSQVLDHIHVGKRVSVTGSTPDFLRITDETGTGTPGYVPFDVVRVMNPEQEASLCYSIEIESKLLKYPNAHSDVVGDVGQGTDLPVLGTGLHHFPFVRNYSGGEGYVTSDEVVSHGRCPDY